MTSNYGKYQYQTFDNVSIDLDTGSFAHGQTYVALSRAKSLEGISLLSATQQNGINTVGSSLRNPNLQLRSEPPNPRTNTNCPWNVSTIESDNLRKPLEIGA